MAKRKLQVSDTVKAISNNYRYTCECVNWQGRVTEVDDDGYFSAITTSGELPEQFGICVEYGGLLPADFKPIK